jgi:hypothetical protein
MLSASDTDTNEDDEEDMSDGGGGDDDIESKSLPCSTVSVI